jgi:exonuclease VII large subunit
MAQRQPTADDARLLQVRELLFGDDLSRIDAEFRKRDADLGKQLHLLADRLERRVQSLDDTSRQARDHLGDELQRTVETTDAESQARHARLEARVDDLQKATGDAVQELRDGIAVLRADLEETRGSLLTRLEESLDAMRRRSVARTDLAETLDALARAVAERAPDPAT